MPYLSHEVPRWTPKVEADIATAADGGLLQESHYLDIKASVPTGSAKNRELARDIASFAIDGGAMLIGVAERDDARPELAPVELQGLAERVEQVARSIPDPPIPVTCTPIAATSTAGHGYLLIEIPATGTAPHMVDGAYMGRGDKTKTRLSDPEVVRLHELRERTLDRAEQLLDAYVRRDPISPQVSAQAHGFVVAAPLRPRPEMLFNVLPDGRWNSFLQQLRDQGAYTPDTILASPGQYNPSLLSASEFSRRSDGAALTYMLGPAREPMKWHDDHPPSEDVVELEVSEEGVIRVMTTRLGDATEERGQVVFEDVLPDLTRRTIGLATSVAERTGYLGSWVFGVAATNIAGKSAYGTGRIGHSALSTFGTDYPEYRQYAEASTTELQQAPGALTQRLVGRFLRSVGFHDAPHIRPLLED
jgi:hypothetical protein